MSSTWWKRLANVAGVFTALAFLSIGASARPVTGSLGGTGGGNGCFGDAYFCSLGAQSGQSCETFVTTDVDCLDLMNIPNSDESARQAQRAFGEKGMSNEPALPRSATGTGLRLVASIVGIGRAVGPDGTRVVVTPNGVGLWLQVFDTFDGPLLLALSPTADSVSYLLLDGATSFDNDRRLSLNLSAIPGAPYYGLTLYQATGAVPEPGSVALALLALALSGLAARRRRS